jgi:L-ascorbate metabolism protein UlaG (beta-lactamase superfamily)
VVLNKKSFPETIHEGLTFSWLGHSSVLLEISGCRILIDPVLSKYASPIIRTIKAARKNNVRLTGPFIGEIVNIESAAENKE